MRFHKYPFLILLFLPLFSCVKDKPEGDSKDFVLPPFQESVLIVNEGSLGLGNASLSVLDLQNLKMYADVFKEVNDMSMGDIFQSAYRVDDVVYLMLNNSNEILVVDAQNFQLLKRISVKKPRQMLKVNEDIAYVTSLFNNQIYLLNLHSNEIVDSITIPHDNSEQLVLLSDKVYVCNWNKQSDQLIAIDVHSHQIQNYIDLGVAAAHGIVVDADQHIWVFSGQPSEQVPAAITVYDPLNNQIIKQKIYDGVSEMIKPVTNETRDTLYFLGVDYDGGTEGNGVFYVSIYEEEITPHTFLQAQAYQYFWGLAYDKLNRHVYIADPKGFIQKGKLLIYTPEKELFFETSTGIGPGNFLFMNE